MKWRSPAVVDMVPTTFQTHTLRPLGQDATTLALPAPHYRRVLIIQPGAIIGAFVSRSASELSLPGQPQPGEAYQLPSAVTGFRVFVLGPGDGLYAAGGTSAGPLRLSVSISQEIPIPLGLSIYEAPTVFRTFSVPTIGINPSIPVVPIAKIPRRVVVTTVTGGVFLSDSAEALNIPQAIPGDGFQVTFGGGIFVVAPGQGLYAINIVAGLGTIRLSISDIHLTRGFLKGNR